MKKWFSGIRSRLLLVSAFAAVSLLIVGGVGLYTTTTLTEKLDIAYNQRMKLVDQLGEIESGLHATFRWLWVAYANENNSKDREIFILKTRTTIKALDESINGYLALPRVGAAQELFNTKFAPNWENSKKIINEIILELEKNTTQATDTAKALIMTKLRPAALPVSEAQAELHETANDVNKKIVIESLNYAQNAKIISIIVMILGTILCFSLSIYIVSQLVKVLSGLSSDLNNSAFQVSSAASQIASASEELSQATTEQAASLQETSSSIEEISSMINSNSQNAKQSSGISGQSLNTAERGKVVVGHMIKAIGEINTSNTGIMDQIDETNKEIENIVRIINEIGNKTKVINDIVFQTKLLSFNASVEAARAGEQGKGFAVVAEEVGNLAAMSGAAALEITNMLDESTRTVEGIVRDSKEKIGKLILNGREKVETGTRVAHECEEVLNEVVISVASVSKMINEISTASQEQALGVHEITKAVSQLDQVTQENTASSAESANAAGTLSTQAEMLNALVQKLVQVIEGGEVKLVKNNQVKVNKSPVIEKVKKEKTVKMKMTQSSNPIPNPISKIPNSAIPSGNDDRFTDV